MTSKVLPINTDVCSQVGCEARTLKKEEERRSQDFEKKCIRKLRIIWTTGQFYNMAGTENELLSHINSRNLRYFGHVMRISHDNIEASVMTGHMEGVRNVENQEFPCLTS